MYDASYKKGLDNDVYMKGWDEDTIAWVAYQIYKGEEPEAFESVSTITVKTGEWFVCDLRKKPDKLDEETKIIKLVAVFE